MLSEGMAELRSGTDFFVSYTGVDKAWGEWIAYVLEEANFSVVIQAWDFRPGSNFVLQMQKSERSIAGRAACIADRSSLPQSLYRLPLSRAGMKRMGAGRAPAASLVGRPLPDDLMMAIDMEFGLRAGQRGSGGATRRLWPWHRVTAWRLMKNVMSQSGIIGRPACPRGLRHGFGVGALQAGVPLNLVQRWLGHARLSTTAIYADASGPEERQFAGLFWASTDPLT